MASKRPRKGRSKAQRQVQGGPPVVEDAKLPRMGEGDAPPLRIGGRVLLMPEEPQRDAGTRSRMAPLRRGTGPGGPRPPRAGYPDQVPPKPPRRAKSGGASKGADEGYVRLRLLVHDGELSVTGAKFVEGPLAATETFHPGLAYEVTLGPRPLAAGTFADAGVWRSFPDPLGRPGLEGHHVTEVPSYEVAVRVPRQKLSMSALPRMRIRLYRWHGTGPAAPAPGRPLKAQLKGRVDAIATLNGIRLSRLSKHAQAELRAAFE